jgi:hypothetical protein
MLAPMRPKPIIAICIKFNRSRERNTVSIDPERGEVQRDLAWRPQPCFSMTMAAGLPTGSNRPVNCRPPDAALMRNEVIESPF